MKADSAETTRRWCDVGVPALLDALVFRIRGIANDRTDCGRMHQTAAVEREIAEIKRLVGLGEMKMATATIGDHVCAVIVYGETQEEANMRALNIVDAWNLTYKEQP